MASKLDEYLDSLPSGLNSFELCRAKGSLVRTSFALAPLRAVERLPLALRAYVATPPLATQWIPETHYVALSLAAADEHGFEREQFREFWRRVMHGLTDGMYSTLLGLVHPETLIKTTATRWAHFHEGTTVSATRADAGVAVHFEFATGLFPELIVEGYAGVLQGLIDRSRKPEGRATRSGLTVRGARTVASYLLNGW
ncbi:MAG: hypothetical protein JNK05_30750 [Myxococcales bacterium]|nr:hypothetical protein [Myxococcales bacterium]